MRDAFHQVAITADTVGIVVNDIETRLVISRGKMLFRNRKTYGHGKPLPKRPSCHFYAVGIAALWMSGGIRLPLAELLQILDADLVSGEVEHTVKQCGSVSV